MAKQSEETGGLSGVLEGMPTDRLKEQTRDLMSALADRAVAMATDKVGDVTERLVDYVETGGSSDGDGGKSLSGKLLGVGASGVKQMVKNKLSGGGGDKGGGKETKATNIVEEVEVGVPVRVAYNQWTEFQNFPKYTKRVETVEQKADEKLTWKAGIFLSHRTWESTIIEQVPDEVIVWRSSGEKGSADGTVTFHELAPNLTKILLVLEYHPQGFFERTGNLWRAQGRRVRLELKHFCRHVMRQTILDPDGVEGWRGEIRDGEVVRSHEEAIEEEQEGGGDEEYDEEAGEEPEEEYDEESEEEPEEEYDEEAEEEPEEEYDEEEPEDEYDEEEYDGNEEEPGYDEEEPEEDDYEAEEQPRSSSRRAAARSR